MAHLQELLRQYYLQVLTNPAYNVVYSGEIDTLFDKLCTYSCYTIEGRLGVWVIKGDRLRKGTQPNLTPTPWGTMANFVPYPETKGAFHVS
jgi:hypothetical protein